MSCIIVLPNKLDHELNINSECRLRMEKCYEVFLTMPEAKVITSGSHESAGTKIKVGEEMKKYGVELGIPANSIIASTLSRDTVGDAFFTKKIVADLGFKCFQIVTSEYHIPRAKEIFEFVYGDDFTFKFVGVQMETDNDRTDKEISSLGAFRKTFQGVASADDKAIAQRVMNEHPLYKQDLYYRTRLTEYF